MNEKINSEQAEKKPEFELFERKSPDGYSDFFLLLTNGVDPKKIDEVVSSVAKDHNLIVSFYEPGRGSGNPLHPRWEIVNLVSHKKAEELLEDINNRF